MLAAAGVVAHDAIEDNDGAVFASLGGGNEFFCVDGIAGEGDDHRDWIGSARRTRSSAGDGRKQSHLIAVAQYLGGCGVFGVYADGDAAQLGGVEAFSQFHKQVGNGRALGQFDWSGMGAEGIF